MSDKNLKPVVMALGYFDSVHLGHRKVIETARKIANENGCSLVVFTFKGNLKAKLKNADEKCVYLYNEREILLKEVGADEIYFAPVDVEFLSLTEMEFLQKIENSYDVKRFVCGTDYRFGKYGKGNVKTLKDYCEGKDCGVVVVDDFNFGGEKVSTTLIKSLLTDGKIEKANFLLGKEYFMTGTVFKDRHVGAKMGFPTVNIPIVNDKFRIKDGVYYGEVAVDGTAYKALINYGGRPTFSLDEKLVEAFLIDFNGDLYGKELTVVFKKRVRDVIKFESEDKLILQIKEDLQSIKEEIND